MERMENKVQIFNNPEFGTVRTVSIDGEPWLVGRDVAEALGYSNPRKALIDHVDEEDKYQGDGVTIRDSIGRKQCPTIINESGLYSLALSSKLPGAKKSCRPSANMAAISQDRSRCRMRSYWPGRC